MKRFASFLVEDGRITQEDVGYLGFYYVDGLVKEGTRFESLNYRADHDFVFLVMRLDRPEVCGLGFVRGDC